MINNQIRRATARRVRVQISLGKIGYAKRFMSKCELRMCVVYIRTINQLWSVRTREIERERARERVRGPSGRRIRSLRSQMRCEIRLVTSVTARWYDKVSKECLTCDCLSVRSSICPICLSVPPVAVCCCPVCVGLPHCRIEHFSCSCGCCFAIRFHIAAFYALVLNASYTYRYVHMYLCFFFIYWQRHVDETAAEPHTFLFTLQKVLSASRRSNSLSRSLTPSLTPSPVCLSVARSQ